MAKVTDTEPEKLPPLGVMVGAATVGMSDTVRLNDVDLDNPPPLPVTVMGKVPVGVRLVVTIDRVDEQVGPQEAVERTELAPLGSPETEKDTV